jgi:hypothetical protein
MRRAQALVSLRGFLSMPANWDSYGAARIDPLTVARAVLLLDSLAGGWQPVPLSDGGVQLELHEGGFDIEITIRAHPTPADPA